MDSSQDTWRDCWPGWAESLASSTRIISSDNVTGSYLQIEHYSNQIYLLQCSAVINILDRRSWLISHTVSIGVPLLRVDAAHPPIPESTLTFPALLLPPEGPRSHTPPARPGTPVLGGGGTSERGGLRPVWSLAAVVLLVVVGPELLAVVSPTHQTSSTATVTVIDSSVSRTVTVTLSLTTGLLRSTTPPPVVVTAPTPLTRGRSQGSPGHDDRS